MNKLKSSKFHCRILLEDELVETMRKMLTCSIECWLMIDLLGLYSEVESSFYRHYE